MTPSTSVLFGIIGLLLGLSIGLVVALVLLARTLSKRDAQLAQLTRQGSCWVRSQLPPHADP